MPTIPTSTYASILTTIFLHVRYLLHLHGHLPSFHFLFELRVVLLNLHLQLHEICFTNVFVSFILVIILNTLTFTSFVLLGTQI